jgi:hypothetical protein
MSKNDDELNEFKDDVTDGTYNLSCVEEGIKICITADMWYSYSYVCVLFTIYFSGSSLLGITSHVIIEVRI